MNEQNKKVPTLRFNVFTDDWERYKLGEISSTFSGGTPSVSNKNYYGGKIPFIRSAEINQNSTQLYLTEDGLNNSSAKLVKKGTLLYALYGATSGEVGIAQIDGAINQAIMAIDLDDEDTYFVKSWLEKNKSRIISTYLQGGQGNLSAKLIKKLVISLPKIKEQIQISSLISRIDILLTLQQRKLDLLKQLKKGLLQKVFADKDSKRPILRFSGFTGDWEQCKLGDISEKTYSGLSGKSKEDFGHGNAKYITYLNVHDNAVADPEGTDKVEIDSKQNNVIQGDLLFTVSSEVPEEVALNSVWPIDSKNIYLNSFCFGLRPLSNKINSFFLTYYLRSPKMRKAVYPLAQGISRFNISKKNILKLDINIPEKTEQVAIYRSLKLIEGIIAIQQQKLSRVTKIKKSLLQQMFI